MKQKLKEVLKIMHDSIENDNIALFERIIYEYKMESFNDPEKFYYALLYPWKKFISGYLKVVLNANEDVEFIYTNYNFINNHFCKLFTTYEGSPFSADKSRTVVLQLLMFYEKGEKIEFDYSAEYTYHLPKKIFKTHDEIIEFYQGLKSLLYGNPQKYLEALRGLME